MHLLYGVEENMVLWLEPDSRKPLEFVSLVLFVVTRQGHFLVNSFELCYTKGEGDITIVLNIDGLYNGLQQVEFRVDGGVL